MLCLSVPVGHLYVVVFPLSSYYSYSISISRYEVKDEQEAAHIFNQVPAMQVSFHVEEIVLPGPDVVVILVVVVVVVLPSLTVLEVVEDVVVGFEGRLVWLSVK